MKKHEQLRNPLRNMLTNTLSKQLRYQIETHIWYWSSDKLWDGKVFTVRNSLNDSLRVK
jgi:hypothetical protein